MELKEKSEKKFKSFNETYPFCAFGLAVGNMYPNKHKMRQKFIMFLIVLFVNFAALLWFLDYTLVCIQRRDWYNLMRNLNVLIILTLFFIKTFYINYKNDEYAQYLAKVSKDLLKANEVEKYLQIIYEDYIKKAKVGETVWIIIPVIFSAQFPVYAGIYNMYETLKSDVEQKHMHHEMELKLLKDKQYETPYFEIVYAYSFLQCFAVMPCFIGLDGSFCIATTHLRMKLRLVVAKIDIALKKSKDRFELKERIKDAIRDHQDALQFYHDTQEIYGGWLFLVFLLTSLLISCNLYMIYLKNGVDPKYAIFVISSVIHMYAPCYYASALLEMTENLSFDIYCTPWEKWADPVVTNLLIFVIAKAQRPMFLTGKGIVTFNMQLFVSIMQTSYSFFALITS